MSSPSARAATSTLIALLAAAPTLAAPATPGGSAGPGPRQPVIGLIIRSEDNPFFTAIRQAAEQSARAEGARLIVESGKEKGAGGTAQKEAIERLVAEGAGTILITPSDSGATVSAIEKARAAGVLVIALDTPTTPATATDALFSTDNRRAGELIGRYARAAWAARGTGRPPRVALLDLSAGSVVGEQRRQGFLSGIGMAAEALTCRSSTDGGSSQGRQAIETCLEKGNRVDIVAALNEPTAAGAAMALERAGLARSAILVTVDGSCLGVRGVADGSIAATAQQFPYRMGSFGVEAGVAFARTGSRPTNIDTGTTLITAEPRASVPSGDLQEGLASCWGASPEIADGRTAYAYPETRSTVALVEAAASEIRRRGDGVFPELRQKDGRWFRGDRYLFVLDASGNPLVLPVAPAQQQGNADQLAAPLRQRILDAAADGRGWVHYRYPKPGGGEPVWKSTYVMRVVTPDGKPLIVGSGNYETRMENAFVVEKVAEAAALLERKGRGAFPELRDPNGPFVFRDTYVFVSSPDGVELVNPAFPALVGQNLRGLKDAEGKPMVRDYLLLALQEGSGWTTYLWPRTAGAFPSRKLTYVRRVTTPEGETLVVGAGVYEP